MNVVDADQGGGGGYVDERKIAWRLCRHQHRRPGEMKAKAMATKRTAILGSEDRRSKKPLPQETPSLAYDSGIEFSGWR